MLYIQVHCLKQVLIIQEDADLFFGANVFGFYDKKFSTYFGTNSISLINRKIALTCICRLKFYSQPLFWIYFKT